MDSYYAVVDFIPTVLSTLQLGLFLVFKNDTPRQLCEECLDEVAMYELTKMYKTTERRIQEYENLRDMMVQFSFQYPNYLRLFSSTHIWRLIEGSLFIVLRSCGENIIKIGRASCRERVYVLV